jgi:hypothetical protein
LEAVVTGAIVDRDPLPLEVERRPMVNVSG